MRFVLVDRITSLEKGKSLTAIKNLSLAEEYLADHFPGFPVLPGVLMIEALVQSSAWLMRHNDEFAFSNVLLKQVRAVKFNNFVAPGNTLNLKVEIQKWDGNLCTLQGNGTVNGGTAVSAKLTLERFNLADRNPELASTDEYEIRKLKELFGLLWSEPKAVAAS
ncbi:MAG: 3-hydroxyacyl-ACP dehydratase FabZ family protein [Planctomycetota bacterium]